MQTRILRSTQIAFTLIELLTVIAIIGILAALVLPVYQKAGARAKRIQCVSNLRQNGIAFNVFMHDHDGKFPMQVSTNDGGTLEYIYASYSIAGKFYFQYHHFQALSNELARASLLVCPTDQDRFASQDFSTLSDLNISYFIGANADFSQPNSILAGDRNVTNSFQGDATILRLSGITYAYWTHELHVLKGNVLYADGRVEELGDEALKLANYNSPSVLDLILPSVNKPSTNQPTPAAAGPSEPPPGFPPMPHRRPTIQLQYQSAQSGNSSQNRSSPPPAGGSSGSSTPPTGPPRINPPIVVNPPAPVFPSNPVIKRTIIKTNVVAEPPPEPAPVIAEVPEKIVTPGSHWPWWLLILLALLIGIWIGRKLRQKKQPNAPRR